MSTLSALATGGAGGTCFLRQAICFRPFASKVRMLGLWASLSLSWLVCANLECGAAAVLTHRYPFTEGGQDVIGGADATLKGMAVIQDGAVVFDGTNSAVELPPNLFTNYNSVTFELWVDDQTIGPKTSSTLFYFGGASYFNLNSVINASANSYALLSYGAGVPVKVQALHCPVPRVGRRDRSGHS